MKVAFATLGCRVNIYESEAMTEKFKSEGYDVVDFDEKAEVYVINTCTVTNMGDKKSRQYISKAKKKNPEAVVAVVGCYSQTSPDEVSAIEGVDVVLGTRNKGDIVYYVNRAMDTKEKFVVVKDVLRNKVFEELKIEDFEGKTRAFLKVQDGCNRFCSYCLIPYARGAVCSKNPETIIDEVNKLADNGFKEIILSGIHIASYGVDLEERKTLMDIIEEIHKINGIKRIRIGSVEPRFFTDEVIEKMASMEKMCPHFHLSLQSGCDATLKRMNRKYTAEEYFNTVVKLRERIPNVSITTDVIVGFPGETAEEFNETFNYLKELRLAKMHIFKYSPRKGTKAADMKDDVHGTIKEERSKLLQELDRENEKNFIQDFIGEKLEVLVEEKLKDDDRYIGYTSNYIKVIIDSTEDIVGKIITVRLIENKGDYATCTIES